MSVVQARPRLRNKEEWRSRRSGEVVQKLNVPTSQESILKMMFEYDQLIVRATRDPVRTRRSTT